MVAVATALDAAGVPLIEVTHGDGLGGASVNYGFPAHSDEEYLRAVIPRLNKREGLGAAAARHRHGRSPADGAGLRRRHHPRRHALHRGRRLRAAHRARRASSGSTRSGFLMMAHMIEPAQLLAQAKLMESYGANCIYCTDSAGYMLPDDVTARIGLLREKLSPATEIGFHGHHNLAMGIANSLAAIEAGAARIDGSAAGLGAGAGNTPLEVFVAVLDRMGVAHGIDLFKLMDVAEDLVVPMMDQPVRIDRDALILGYAGVYSSFLLFAKRAGAKYGVPSARHPGRARPAQDRRRPGGHDRGPRARHGARERRSAASPKPSMRAGETLPRESGCAPDCS